MHQTLRERDRLPVATATQTPRGVTLSHQTTFPRHPLTFWHLLSLDAPTVAALWTWFIASANHLHLPAVSIVAMFLAVWMLYAADRLLDARNIDASSTGDLEARHYFHNQHRSAFLTGILAASITLAILLPRLDPRSHPPLPHPRRSALRLFHPHPRHQQRSSSPKGDRRRPLLRRRHLHPHRSPPSRPPHRFTPTRGPLRYGMQPQLPLHLHLGTQLPCAIRPARTPRHPAGPAKTSASHHHRHLPQRCLLHTRPSDLWSIPCAITASTLLLLLLHHRRHHTARLTLRSLADLALITPLLLLPLLPR